MVTFTMILQLCIVLGALWVGSRYGSLVQAEHNTQDTRNKELHVGVLELMRIASQRHCEGTILPYSTIHKPHRENKAHRSQHTDRWKIFHCVEAVVLQDGECRRISQSNRRHEESHTRRIECYKSCLVSVSS